MENQTPLSNVDCKIRMLDMVNSRPPSNVVFKFSNVRRLCLLFRYVTNKQMYNHAHAYVEASKEGLFFKLSNIACDAHVCIKLNPDAMTEFLCNNDIPLRLVNLLEIRKYLRDLPAQEDEIGVYQFTTSVPQRVSGVRDNVVKSKDIKRCKGMGIFAPVFAPPHMPKKMPAPVTSLPFNELPYAIYKVNYKNASFVLNGTQYEELIVTVSPNTVKFTTTAVATPLSITEVVQQFQFGGGPFEAIFTVFNGQDVAYPLLEHARNSLFELTFFKGPPARMQISMNIQDLGELTFLSTEKRSEDEDAAEIEDEVALLQE